MAVSRETDRRGLSCPQACCSRRPAGRCSRLLSCPGCWPICVGVLCRQSPGDSSPPTNAEHMAMPSRGLMRDRTVFCWSQSAISARVLTFRPARLGRTPFSPSAAKARRATCQKPGNASDVVWTRWLRDLQVGRVTSRRGELVPATPRPEPEPQVAKGADIQGLRVPVGDLRPNRYQPRGAISEQSIQELAESLQSSGMIQPISARRSSGGLEIVAGERRWRAAPAGGARDRAGGGL